MVVKKEFRLSRCYGELTASHHYPLLSMNTINQTWAASFSNAS